jgi:DNA end-binding protein Ku
MRAIWNGSISFGLVNIPVRLYSAAKERALSFRLLAKDDLCPISYKKVCRDHDREIEQKDIVKGYEVTDGQYVILEPADFKKASAAKTELIDIVEFVKENEIDAKLYDKPYYIEPLKKSEKAYALLRDALKESGKVGVATFVMREKQHIATVRPENDVLILDQMRFADEIRDPEDINAPHAVKYTKKELDLAKSLIDSLSETFKVSDFKDTYTDQLMKVIKAKARGELKEIKEPAKEIKATDVSDILDALKRSIDRDKKKSRHEKVGV